MSFGANLERRIHGVLDSRRLRPRLISRPATRQKQLRGKYVRTFLGHNRPERITPKSSQTPSAPESRKPMNERKLTPKTNGPCLAKIPIRLEPIRPPTTISATTRRLKARPEE